MARKPVVSRTIKSTKVNVLCMDIITAEPTNVSVTVARTYKDEKTLMKAVKSVVETDTLKVVHIVDTEIVKETRAMTEQKFIEHSEVVNA